MDFHTMMTKTRDVYHDDKRLVFSDPQISKLMAKSIDNPLSYTLYTFSIANLQRQSLPSQKYKP